MGTDEAQGAAKPPAGLRQGRLLRDLCAGRTSRNRDFERFRDPAAHRVLTGYRRLASLARELGRPGVEVSVARSEEGEDLLVEVRLRRLRYHRVARLTSWEFAVLREEMMRRTGAEEILSRFPMR